MDWPAIALSARLSLCTALILLVLGLPLAYWLATTRWRGRIFLEAVVALPLVLPPTVLGFYILLATGPKSSFGQGYEALTGKLLPFSFQGLLLASTLYSLPFAVQPFLAAFRGLDRRLVEAALSVGATPWKTFWGITVPLCWPGLLSGVVLSFAHTVGEFGVVLMVGGNIEGVTRTVAVSIYDDVQSLNYQNAARTSLLLLCFSFAVLSLTYALQRNFRFLSLKR
jgi:molybdate transport system permease protein